MTAAALAHRARFDAEALPQLDALLGFALKLTGMRADAEDLVSETVLRALDRWEQYQPGTNIRAWMFTILYHLFVSRRRRVDLREQRSDASCDARLDSAVGDDDPERRFYDSFIDDEVMRAVDALPEEYRVAVILSDLHELRYAEIAARLGIPEGTVKSRLFRGRKILQRALRGYASELGIVKRAVA